MTGAAPYFGGHGSLLTPREDQMCPQTERGRGRVSRQMPETYGGLSFAIAERDLQRHVTKRSQRLVTRTVAAHMAGMA